MTETSVFLLYRESMPRVKNNRTPKNANDVRELVDKSSSIYDVLFILIFIFL